MSHRSAVCVFQIYRDWTTGSVCAYCGLMAGITEKTQVTHTDSESIVTVHTQRFKIYNWTGKRRGNNIYVTVFFKGFLRSFDSFMTI